MSDRLLIKIIADHVLALGNPPRVDFVGLAKAARGLGQSEARDILERLWGAAFVAGAKLNADERSDLNEALVVAKGFLEAIADRNPTGGDVQQAPLRSDESGGAATQQSHKPKLPTHPQTTD